MQTGDKKRRQKIESSNFSQDGEKIIVTWNFQSEQEMNLESHVILKDRKTINTVGKSQFTGLHLQII